MQVGEDEGEPRLRPADDIDEHHLAVIVPWRWRSLSPDPTARQFVFEGEDEPQILDVRKIQSLAGRVKTAFHDFIVSTAFSPDNGVLLDTVEDASRIRERMN